MTKKAENTNLKIAKQSKRKKVTPKELSDSSSTDDTEQSDTEVNSNKRKKFSASTSKTVVNMQPIEQSGVKTKSTPKTASNSRKKIEKNDQKIEVVAIRYVCPSEKHPNHALHDHIDRYPIEQIIGYGTQFFKRDVIKRFNLLIFYY
jgi:hypothetical protein